MHNETNKILQKRIIILYQTWVWKQYPGQEQILNENSNMTQDQLVHINIGYQRNKGWNHLFYYYWGEHKVEMSRLNPTQS